jgi:hypothetical protein
MAFRDEHIRAIVQTGHYSDPRAEDWVIRVLIGRRQKIGRSAFSKVLPLDRFRVENGRLEFVDLFTEYGFGLDREFQAEWFDFDNNSGVATSITGASGFALPEKGRGAQYLAARINGHEDPHKTVTVFLRMAASGAEVVGVERAW